MHRKLVSLGLRQEHTTYAMKGQKPTYLPLGQDLEQSKEVEENKQHVDTLNTDGMEEILFVVFPEEHVKTISGEHSQQHNEEEHNPDKGWEADCPAATLLKYKWVRK